MLSKDKLDRINVLARKSKNSILTETEKLEQKFLREEYLEAFRESFRKQLENIEIHYEDDPLSDSGDAKEKIQ